MDNDSILNPGYHQQVVIGQGNASCKAKTGAKRPFIGTPAKILTEIPLRFCSRQPVYTDTEKPDMGTSHQRIEDTDVYAQF